MAGERYPHIQLNENFRTPLNYKKRPQKIEPKPHPEKDRSIHGAFIRRKFDEAWAEATREQHAVAHPTRKGVYIEVVSDPGVDLAITRLEDFRSKTRIRVVNSRNVANIDGVETKRATLYIPNARRAAFSKKIDEYRTGNTEKGAPLNAPLINTIGDISKAILESFWTDRIDLIPKEAPEFLEVWLSEDTEHAENELKRVCNSIGIGVTPGYVSFPERRVIVVNANRPQLIQLYQSLDFLAELRKARESAAYWLKLDPEEEAGWVENLKVRINTHSDSPVSICILDTGVNRGHPLLESLLSEGDQHAFDSEWGTHDHNGHGTLMAGVAGFGDLKSALETGEEIQILHNLESVKILPPRGRNPKRLYGHITNQAISLATIQAPERTRIYCVAVTTVEDMERGRPSSWSGFIDRTTSGVDDDVQKLFVVSAGNTELNLSQFTPDQFPSEQIVTSIQDPAQSWNTLTVGAYTELVDIKQNRYPGYRPLARQGGLSPFTTCSTEWDPKWPLKPDVMFEGGNLAISNNKLTDDCDDLWLLSTNGDFQNGAFEGFNSTSSACAQAAWFAAQIQVRYPEMWPETIRGLVAHSAEWTDEMKASFLPERGEPTKSQYARLARICGWGVPNLSRALYSASNSLTLISEATIQPYEKGKSGGYKAKEWHKYTLPWPKDALLSLPSDTPVGMRITLSYFIEPGPGEIGWKDRYKYPSHGLRFDIKRPLENEENFDARISAATEAGEGFVLDKTGTSDLWTLGSDNRHKGSLHSDIWNGTSAALAESNIIAIYPIKGWWAERHWLKRGESTCRYSLVVSIWTPSESVDLYVPVATQIGVSTPVEITI